MSAFVIRVVVEVFHHLRLDAHLLVRFVVRVYTIVRILRRFTICNRTVVVLYIDRTRERDLHRIFPKAGYDSKARSRSSDLCRTYCHLGFWFAFHI